MSARLAHVLMTTDAVGGVWTYTVDLARGFAAQEIETIAVVLGPSPSAAQRADMERIAGLRLIDSRLPLEWTARSPEELDDAAAQLAELAEALRPDIVHLNTPALAAGMCFPAPVVVMAHSCLASWWRIMRREALPADFRWRVQRTRAGMSNADAVIAASSSFAAALREIYGAGLPIAVVRNGRRSEPVEIEKRRLVFTAGRLWDEGKNIALLDRIAPALDAPLLAAGPLVAPHGAAAHYPHLRCLGSLSERDIAPWYAAAAIFAAPARYEPFGLAVLQAAQAGAALVLSDIPTFRELWGDAALLLSPDDPGAWRKALARLLELPERVRALGAAAQARAARYSVDTMVAGTLAIYRGALMSGDAVSLPLRSAS